ncbi:MULTISPECIES: flippase-like domain-containing protein [unclassified Caballeronia]|uniref:flippase-like domain-containing protein n=1 Tax=unclassified Caballeronia TaxID=2646786 RepID=UPI0028595BBB|nr:MULTISPECIES: flippase-like domain-containing protein [unclassified Caballeronia]MDR5749904.1 flippase-like domain-containing protein [Caballeronia sp. LZ024]MDR5842968.1 flippase-like domain-containing protein [Caballeronia sp. LZ031]
MSRAGTVLLSIGVVLFIALIGWQGFGSVASTLAAAGWGLVAVAAFHLLPVVLDAGAISVLFGQRDRDVTLRDAVLARWSGESVNSLMPAGQIGGPMLMVRYLAQRGMRARDAAAVITVSTTMQTIAQLLFALIGVALLGSGSGTGVRNAVLIVIVVIGAMIFGFYLAQRRGLFGRAMRFASLVAARFSAKRDWSSLVTRAEAVDAAVHEMYRERGKVAASFALSFVGWIVGTGEVWLALRLIGHPVDWTDALILESLGQAIRGAAFAIPGSLGVQEGGYLLLARLVGLPPEAALALSLAKRARELLLGVPGIVYLHFVEKGWQRRRLARVPEID